MLIFYLVFFNFTQTAQVVKRANFSKIICSQYLYEHLLLLSHIAISDQFGDLEVWALYHLLQCSLFLWLRTSLFHSWSVAVALQNEFRSGQMAHLMRDA